MLGKTMKFTVLGALLGFLAAPTLAQESFRDYERDVSVEAKYILRYDTTAAGRWVRVRRVVPTEESWLAGPSKVVGETGKAVGAGAAGAWKAVQAPFAAKEGADRYVEEDREKGYILRYDTTAAGRWRKWRGR